MEERTRNIKERKGKKLFKSYLAPSGPRKTWKWMIEHRFQDGLPFKGNKIWIFLCLDHRRKNALVLINPLKAYKPWVVPGNIYRQVCRFKLPKEMREGAAWESGDLGPAAYSSPGLLFDFSINTQLFSASFFLPLKWDCYIALPPGALWYQERKNAMKPVWLFYVIYNLSECCLSRNQSLSL